MSITDVAESIRWQADHAERAGAPCTARVVRATLALLYGASAGINTMMGRYFYDLGGVHAGPEESPMRTVPEWRGRPPPQAPVQIVSAHGCDVAPVDLTDLEQVLRLSGWCEWILPPAG